jgi:hypothetical protein
LPVFWSFTIGMLFSAAIGSRSLAGPLKPGSPGITDSVAPRQNPQAAEASAYMSSIGLVGVRVGDGLTGKGVFGEVKNNGNRILSKVEITIYCLGDDNKPVFEKTYTPVLVSSFSLGDANEPLKSGYSRKFGVRLDDAPSDWAGDVNVKITGVEFAEPKRRLTEIGSRWRRVRSLAAAAEAGTLCP